MAAALKEVVEPNDNLAAKQEEDEAYKKELEMLCASHMCECHRECSPSTCFLV